ncbi:hypothetical protein PsorP6_000771 [Peronosclerospora sorghi]|uniref:Uncharacterized protein n=1 Tax=Peronosclerospora sorghi TaxID=230839 RepID=A0ACC0WTP1_9STRA|nr:hypothetical protein PsorP6_000771 [Peronosclerospora sorghi]
MFQSVQRKKRKKEQRERPAKDSADGQDACDELYQAAQAQLKQEMKVAGMEGWLPTSFGSGRRSKRSRKRKRSLEIEETVNRVDMEEERVAMEEKKEQTGDENTAAYADEAGLIGGDDSQETETRMGDKMRVIYDSEGEVVERLVDQVEVMTARKLETPSGTEIVRNKARTGKKKARYPVPKDVVKFYMQRHLLFEKFEDGIQLDHESWYSVTPQVIAEHIASRLSCDVVVDPFAGCGGNVIQLARTCKQVIAIDIDPEKIRMAKHNAYLYGVAHQIEWIVGNAIDLLPRIKADVVFLSPPWGGIKYKRECFNLQDMRVQGVSGGDLFAMARKVTKNIAYYLPKGTPSNDLAALTADELVECEKIFVNKCLKVVTAYYGNLVAVSSQSEIQEHEAVNGIETIDTT